MLNRVKQKLATKGTALGSWMSILSDDVSSTLGNSGLDWVLYDLEHGPASIETASRLVKATGTKGALPFIRPVWNDMNAIKQALDTGAWGLVIPWVNDAEQARRAVSYTRYMPEGIRGCAAGRPASAWGLTSQEYMGIANDEIVVAVQIETEEAVKNIESICSVDGVDATFVGPSDLSASMGYRGQFWHPRVVKAMDRVLEVCQDSKVAPGIAFGKGLDHCIELVQQGWRFLCVGSDKDFLRAGLRLSLERFRH
jgi:2-keto-3-deoxy-L-rhamnonate aldolase RhmA